jgi:hypothetical protein
VNIITNRGLLEVIANRVRRAVVAYSNDPSSEGTVWHKNPSLLGACGISSVFLFKQLVDAGFTGATVVVGEFDCGDNNASRHAWIQLESNGTWIVDVTASQFADSLGALASDVVITPVHSEVGGRYTVKVSKFYLREMFAFWSSKNIPWGRLDGKTSHQVKLQRFYDAELAADMTESPLRPSGRRDEALLCVS